MLKKILLILCIQIMLIIPYFQASAQQNVTTLKMGISGQDVYNLQLKLSEYEYYNGPLDGNFGIETYNATLQFQQDYDLYPDGIAGPDTFNVLKQLDNRTLELSRGHFSRTDGSKVASFALQYLDVPYVWAGSSPSGFDCSGFVYYIFNKFGIDLPRMADEQFSYGAWVAQKRLLPGDLVFFSTYEPGPSHVGIYLGDGNFIHASSGAGSVTITPLAKDYYRSRYLGAKRVLVNR